MERRQILSIHEYYSSNEVRNIAHGLKTGNLEAIKRASKEMAMLVDSSCVLVPIPSRRGYATTTLELADTISRQTGARVADILKGKKRESLYVLKADGKSFSSDMLGLWSDGIVPNGKLVFVDNVIATGTTMRAVDAILPNGFFLTWAMDSKAYLF